MDYNQPMIAPPPAEREIFCNRTLNLRSIKAIGYDMDYTLIHYHVEQWEGRAYDYLRDRLHAAGLPVSDLRFDHHSVIRGLVIDTELGNIVKALGCGIGKTFDPSGLRYQRVILLMDADSDGHHIATLLLTFFYRYLPELIRRGHVFIAQPPLFRVDIGKETHWVADDADLQRLLSGVKRGKPEIQRFKGLGEMMPETLKATTLDPKHRQLIRVSIGDELATDRTIEDLMGKDSSARYQFIMERASEADGLDI